MHRHMSSSLTGVVVLAALLGSVPSCAACPASCDCPSPTVAVCYAAPAAGRLPVGLPSNLASLELCHYNLSHLANDTLAGVGALRQLQLQDDKIRWVQPGTFRGLQYLEKLEMQDNYLVYIHPDMFLENSRLWFLDLSANHLHVGNYSAFLNSQSLRELNISRCSLDYLPDEAFQGLPQLQVLHLEGNYLHYLRMRMLSPLQKLTHLHLQDNKINILLNVPAASSHPSLMYIDLSGNFLKTLDVGAMQVVSGASHMNLLANPLVCDCRLEPARTWLERARSVDAPGSCAAPYSLAGADWRSIHTPSCSGAESNTGYSLQPGQQTHTAHGSCQSQLPRATMILTFFIASIYTRRP